MYRSIGIWACLLAMYLLFPALSAGQTGHGPVRSGGADACRAGRGESGSSVRPHGSRSSNAIDVVSYALDITINFNGRTIDSRCGVGVRSLEEGLAAFTLDFVGLEVTAVIENGQRAVVFGQTGDALNITPSTPLGLSETRVYTVSYAGRPQAGLYFNSGNGGVCYTFTEPEDSRYWFPCRDVPRDKADWFRGRITVPSGYLAASNGDLEQVVDNGDGTATYHYHHDDPISTYLISLAISRYQTFSQMSDGGIPMTYYVYSSHYDRAVYDWANVPSMMDFYASVYHPYPFQSYGMAIAPIGGAMEHQTMTTISPSLVNGTRRWEPVVAHELAHQWWGDMVTCSEWPEIWLNEGFATYFDALFTEHFYGEEEFRAQMDHNRWYYMIREPAEGRFPLYDPAYMWGATVYEKGSWVLHMLRHLLGTERFNEGIRLYADRYRYASARTEDLINAFQDVSGTDLSWYFNQWVYQAGYPEFRFTYSGWQQPDGIHILRLALKQVQTNAPAVFIMPVEIGVTTADGGTIHRVDVDASLTTVDLEVDGPVTDIVPDPDVWALATWEYVDLTGDIDGSGRVDGLDNTRLAWAFGSSTGGERWFVPADLNEDGVIDGEDLALLAANFGFGL